MNGGDLGLSNLSAAMISSDPFVSLLYNTTASYPSIGGGVSAENTRDWDTRISPDAPDGHEFEFVLRFTAAEGGPWDVAVAVPIGCGPTPDPGGGGEAAFVSYRVDDGPGHDGTGNDSKGNDDGLPQCGETIELYATLSNVGDDALSGLSALLVESDPYVALLYNSTAAFPDLAAGASRENRLDWDLAISADGPGGHEFSFILRVTAAGGGSWDIPVVIPLDCGEPPDPGEPGEPVLVDFRVDDGPTHDGTGNDSQGNDDGIAQCGELIEVYVRIRNVGETALTGLSAVLVETDDGFGLLYNTSSAYPNLAGGADAENPRDWDLKVGDDVADDHEFSFVLRVAADGGGSWDIDVVIPIDCP